MSSNAVAALVGLLPAELVRGRLAREGLAAGGAPSVRARRLRARYDVDLLGFAIFISLFLLV